MAKFLRTSMIIFLLKIGLSSFSSTVGGNNKHAHERVGEACSVLHLQKISQTPKVPDVHVTYNYNASSFLPNSITNDDNKGEAADPSSCNKIISFLSAL
ncbi:hypothetical protein L1987_36537 [Smallanthus sonchifolius]|uniref:Uncharacterized protein n=1 Tax=Smallanthus sonchifolius TaxID=185202 RepID=A0ACB9HDG7_9ASTR|nr:hypothetical protein L1987_36537 [Smallanthus sonchifolius]